MTRAVFALDRRMVLRGLAASAAAATLPAPARAAEGAEAVLLSMADLHSPYARLPAILSEVRALRAGTDRPMAMILNGDLFERGNVVATRSGAAADWAFLAALCAELPVYINIGNHETAILDDMASFVARATQAGAQVVSNLVDARTGRLFAPAMDRVGLGGITLGLLAVATPNPFVYREPARGTLTFLDPARFAADAFADATAGTDLPVLVSHAGVAADKAILSGLPAGALAIGAHDHLDMLTRETGQTYLHGASWGTRLGVIGLTKGTDGVAVSVETREIAPGGGDPALAETIEAAKAEHLTDDDREVIAELGEARDMHGSILLAAEAVRRVTGADLAVLGHTTFGAPLAAGPLTRYDFDAFIRFDGGLSVAEVPGETLARILSRANQFRAATLEARTGDYVHAAEIDIDPGRVYRLATNGWTAMNQESYLGTTDLAFSEAEGLALKAVVAEHLGTL